MSQILTQSRLKAFRTCARLHQYRYLQCKVPVAESGAARFGTLFHAALEQWWLAHALDGDARLEVAMASLDTVGAADEEELALAQELLRGYHYRWLHEPLVTLHAEHQFEMPVLNPETGRSSRTFTLSGKIDAFVFDERDARKYLVEHKTTTSDISEGSAYWRRLRMDGQVSVYYSAFPEAAGCIYDVIRRPLHRRARATPEDKRTYTVGKACKTCKGKPWPVAKVIETPEGIVEEYLCPQCKGSGWAERPRLHANQRDTDESIPEFKERLRETIAQDPDAFYKRGVVVRLESEIREHQFDVWQQANLMREMGNDDIHPRNPDACIQFNRQCDYFDVCTGVASIEDPRLFQIRDAHPELSKETP